MTTTAMDVALAALSSSMAVIPDTAYPERMSDFIRDTLGADIWEKQIEIADSVDDNRYTSVASAHGVGKSHVAARISLAFLHTRKRSIVITTAPTARQVQHVLWREIRSAHRNSRYPLLGRCLTMRYEISDDWYAIGFKAKSEGSDGSNVSDSFQGFHAEHALVIVDEAAGVPESVFEALDAVMTSANARMLLIGNPTSVSGTFRDTFYRNSSMWNTIRISAFDSPNLKSGNAHRPYLVTKDWVDTQISKRGLKSPYVQARVFAQFPEVGVNKLIPMNWIEAMSERRNSLYETEEGGVTVGIDVARYGDDETVLTIRRGQRFLGLHAWAGFNLVESAKEVRGLLSKYRSVLDVRVDSIGLGAGLADILRNEPYNLPVTDVSVSVAASDPEEWPIFRHEMWWQLRERFDLDGPSIVNGTKEDIDDELMAQLSDIEYGFDNKHLGHIIERKEETKKRTGRSPDRAESLALCYCTPPGPDKAAARPRVAIADESGWANAYKFQEQKVNRIGGAKIARRKR